MPTRAGWFAVTLLLFASGLIGIVATVPPGVPEAEAQTFSRSVCIPETVYVPVFTTVFRTLSYTAYSTSYSLTYSAYTTSYPVTYYSLTTSSLTQLNTVTWTLVTTPVGLFGAWPVATFGFYSDLVLLVGGVLGGVAVAGVLAWLNPRPVRSPKVIGGLTWLNPQPEPPAPLDEGLLFCTKCGGRLTVGQKVCGDCGSALK